MTISVASEDSLLVRFIEPLDEKVIVSKYKSEYMYLHFQFNFWTIAMAFKINLISNILCIGVEKSASFCELKES